MSGEEHTLQAVRVRLEGAHATAVVARQALLRQSADCDLEIARCLAHGVIAVLDAALTALRGLAAGTSPEIDRPVAGAPGTPAAGTLAEGNSSDGRSSDTAVRSTAAVGKDAVRRTRSTARQIHRTLDRLKQHKETKRRTRKRPVRTGAARK
jgi:hypothetical protein